MASLAAALPLDLTDERGLKLLAYAAGELASAFTSIQAAIAAHLQGQDPASSLPASSNGGAQGRKRKFQDGDKPEKPEKRKREPTGFNMFVKRKMQAVKAGAGPTPGSEGMRCAEPVVVVWACVAALQP